MRRLGSRFTGAATDEQARLRDDDRQRAKVGSVSKPSTSTVLQRCSWCREWRAFKENGRCSHCRQLAPVLPLVGLPKVA